MALSCLNDRTVTKNIINDIMSVGITYNIISGLMVGDEASLTIKTVGMKLKTPWKMSDLTKSGTNKIKVAKTSSKVMAELASLVLSTSMDMNIPRPINPKPMKKRTKPSRTGL